MGTYQDYSKSGFTENTITLGLNMFTQNIRITYENDIPCGQIKITQNLDSHKIRLHWASTCVPRKYGLHMKMIFHGASQDYSKSGFAENTITLGDNICTQNMAIT